MNRKFMPIFSQISPTFLLFSAYLFIKIRRLFSRARLHLYTTEVSWLSVNYCRISKEKKVLVELIFLTLNLLIFSTKIYIFLIEEKS